MLAAIALKSLLDRRLAVGLTITGIALSTAMIVGVERIRVDARESFRSTVAGTDLIVGARTSPVQLLLYSVFGIGSASSNVSWSSYQKISRHPSVRWSVPISLGDSHHGYRVVGTTDEYFEHLRFGRHEPLEFSQGRPFSAPLQAVLGATAARESGYRVGDALIIAHGDRDDGITRHEELPFTVSGVLAATGTPADRTVYVPLEGIEAIHVGWERGTPIGNRTLDTADIPTADLHPEQITGFFLGLERRGDVLQVQRAINNFPEEPLLAIVPGVALTELWGLFGTAELALIVVAAMTVLTGLLGMVVGIFSTLNERRREMAVLRSVGARPADIAALLVTESTLIGLAGAVAGYALLTLAVLIGNGTLGADVGIRFSAGVPSAREAALLSAIVVAAMLTGTLPAWRAYRLSLHDGLTAHA